MREVGISGASGIGKTWLVNYMLQNYPNDFSTITSTTTKPQRPGETTNYKHISVEEYLQIEKDKGFVISNPVFKHYYGYEIAERDEALKDGRTPLVILYTPIVDQYLAKVPDMHTIFLLPGNLDLLAERMRLRGDTDESIAVRMKGAKEEILHYAQHPELFRDTFNISGNDISQIVKRILEIRNADLGREVRVEMSRF